jgi:hypothetical protein
MPEFVFNQVHQAHSGISQVLAGTFVVVPAVWCDDDRIEEDENFTFPDYLLVCAGQDLRRELYPGWSSEYPGGFYDFTLPNLQGKFLLGFDESGQPVMGTGCVYFKDVPPIEQPPPRDIRDL